MNESFLILGREKGVSFAEIYQFLCKNDEIITYFGADAIVVSGADFGRGAALILGGVPKSGIVIEKTDNAGADFLASVLSEFVADGQKFHFGLSAYGNVRMSQAKLKALGLEIKRILKNTGISVRMVESKSGNLSSVDVVKNKLLDKGVELCFLFLDDGSVVVGKTESVQPYEEYSHRDFDRPSRDMKRGMIPPKFARSMINMSGAQSGALILDPFCGIGTILQEALLLGYRVIGTDIEEQAIRDTKKNIEWLSDRHPELVDGSCSLCMKQGDPSATRVRSARDDGKLYWRVEKRDVRKLDQTVTEKSIDAIVTEFDLGPALQGDESKKKIESIERSLSEFYSDTLSMMRYVLKDNARAVVAWPYFTEQGIMVSAFDRLGDLGFRAIEPYPAKYQNMYPLSERGTLLYGRPGQHVFREILLLEKSPLR